MTSRHIRLQKIKVGKVSEVPGAISLSVLHPWSVQRSLDFGVSKALSSRYLEIKKIEYLLNVDINSFTYTLNNTPCSVIFIIWFLFQMFGPLLPYDYINI